METFKLLIKALLPIFGLVVMAIIAYVLFNYFPSSNESEYDDVHILIGIWLSLMPIVLAFLYLMMKSDKTNKD